MGSGIVSKSPSELRRYRRVPIDLPARAIINGVNETQGKLINIAPGDLAIRSNAKARVGDAVTVFVTGLDVLEGTVARVFPDGFAISFRLSRVRRALLTERLMEIVNPKLAEGLRDRRTAPRHPMKSRRMVCRMPDGTSLFVRVLDMSVDGVALEATKRPPVGGDIHVGRMRGIVARHTARGFVVVYDHSGGRAAPGTATVEVHKKAG